MSCESQIRLGRIRYLNVLPVYHALEQGLIPHHFQIVQGTPAELNSLMAQGCLELSAASSIEYARNHADYLLLPDLAIGSQGAVKSVLLLSQVPVQELQGKSILVSSQTHTSAALLKMLLETRYQIRPEYQTADVWQHLQSRRPPAAFLAIGDEALMLRNHPQYPWRLDLGQEWLEWTGLPFIFGVWVARKSACREHPQAFEQGVQTLLTSKTWGQHHLGRMASLAASKYQLSSSAMCSYFQGLVFDLGPRELQGLRRFYQELYVSGLIPAEPELEFFPVQNAAEKNC
ncbi:MAG: menaquinone biosynthetic enzyme MqnA/MqnD family protein [Desulfohalobiaceae bacterium]